MKTKFDFLKGILSKSKEEPEETKTEDEKNAPNDPEEVNSNLDDSAINEEEIRSSYTQFQC